MILPEAIERFLAIPPPPVLAVRGADPAYLRKLIKEATGIEFVPKTPWGGSDRDQRQLEAVALALIHRRVLLHYAMRTGKTKISLDWISHLRRAGLIRCALVLPHAPVGLDEWEIQTPVHSDLRAEFVRSGPGAGEALAGALEGDCEMIVIAPSTLQTLFTEKRLSRKKTNKLYPDREAIAAMAGFYDAFVCDEIHGAMWHDSLRHEITAGLAQHAEYRLGLTGTPFGRDPFGLWGQAYIVDGGEALGRSYYFFEQAFGKQVYNHFARSKKSWVFDPKKMEILRARLAPMSLSCTLEEIQDVDIIASTVRLSMSAQQRRAYKELIDEMIKAEDRKGIENIFVRLRQVSSGYRPFRDDEGEERVVEFADAAKFAWVEDLLVSLDPALKVVIFHEFIATGRRLAALCTKHKVKFGQLWGGTRDRRAVVEAFQNGDTQVLIANHATGGTGINLSAADYMCVVESPTSVITRAQMLARPMARARPLVVDDLVCSPVEERILTFHAQGCELLASFREGKKLAAQLAL